MPRGRFAGIPPKKSRNHGLAFADTLVPTIRLVRSAFAGTQCQLFASPPPMPSILYPKNAYFNTYGPPPQIQQNHVRFSEHFLSQNTSKFPPVRFEGRRSRFHSRSPRLLSVLAAVKPI